MSKKVTIYREPTTAGQSAVTVAVGEGLEYHGEWMGDCYVTVTVKSATAVDFQVGDYLEYRGERFMIMSDPNVIKKARSGTYGEGFTYSNVKLYPAGELLKTVGFKDVVLYDNQQAYTSLAQFQFFASSVDDFADRLQANFQRMTVGIEFTFLVLTKSSVRSSQRCGEHWSEAEAVWEKYFPGSSSSYPDGETDVNIEIDNQKCWDVMKMAYEKFGLSYIIDGNYIVIGAPAIKADHIFRYGKGLGLYEIERTADEQQEVVTKVFGYGSETNLPLNYYANLSRKMFAEVTGKEAVRYDEDEPLPGPGDDFEPLDYTEYHVGTGIAYESVRSALRNKGLNMTLVLTKNSTRYTSQAMAITKTVDGTQYLWFSLAKDSVADADQNFYNAVGSGDNIYITGGADVNLWPQTLVEKDDEGKLLSVNRLMLPGFPEMSLKEWVESHSDADIRSLSYDAETNPNGKYIFSTDKNDPWVMSRNNTSLGIREGVVNFDGSQQKEIYPTIEGTGYDEVSWAEQIDDSGYLGENVDDTFLLEPSKPQNSSHLDWEDNDGSLTISMKDGACVGREFAVKNIKRKQNGDVELTLERSKDDSMGGRYFPYREIGSSSLYQVMGRGNHHGLMAGDHFVITGIYMPKGLVELASEKLLLAVCGWLDKRDHIRYTYLPKVDELYMQRQHDATIGSGSSDEAAAYGESVGSSSEEERSVSYHDLLRAGMKMEFEDTDLGIWQSPYIDQLTIKEDGNNGLPTYDVVLRDEKEKGTLEMLTEKVSELKRPTVAPTERQTRPTRDVQYDHWEQGQSYYYQTLNPEPFEGVVYIETSYVWHKGKLWMCMRTLTSEEPGFGCQDWEVVSGSTAYSIEFVSSNGNMFYQGHVDTTVTAHLFWGEEDITSTVGASAFAWTRSTEAGKTSADTAWDGIAGHAGTNVLTLSNEDMPTAWSRTNKAIFTCTATVNDGSSEVIVQNQIIA